MDSELFLYIFMQAYFEVYSNFFRHIFEDSYALITRSIKLRFFIFIELVIRTLTRACAQGPQLSPVGSRPSPWVDKSRPNVSYIYRTTHT